jgi:hypothetical protein
LRVALVDNTCCLQIMHGTHLVFEGYNCLLQRLLFQSAYPFCVQTRVGRQLFNTQVPYQEETEVHRQTKQAYGERK